MRGVARWGAVGWGVTGCGLLGWVRVAAFEQRAYVSTEKL